MRKILLFSLLFIASKAKAQQGVQNVHEVATSTQTITQAIALGAGLTDVAAATSSGTLAGRFAIEVYTVSTSSKTPVCSFDVSLSTAIGNIWYGREIPPGVGVYFAVANNRKLWCATPISGVNATVPVVITQFR